MTRADHQSGSDRIFEALGSSIPQGGSNGRQRAGRPADHRPGDHRAALRRSTIRQSTSPRLASRSPATRKRPTPTWSRSSARRCRQPRLRALYFTRATAPWGDGPLYHHIGLYAYRRAALERFVALPPSPLEKREKLEQLRALEAGMRIDVEHRRHRAARRRHARRPRARPRDKCADRCPGQTPNDQDQPHLLPGRARRQLRHGLPQHVSRHGAAAVPDLRGCASTRWRAARPTSP
jgi:hypothetical protein